MSTVIVALDVESGEQAMQRVPSLGPAADFCKVGLQLLTLEWPSMVRERVDRLAALATHIVVGRAITQAPDPAQAFVQARAQFCATA